MKPAAYILLFLAVLLLPFALRATLHDENLHAAGNTLRLVVITPNNQDIRQEFAWAFDRWHREHYARGVTVDFRVPGGAADIKRQLELVFRNRGSANFSPDYDVLWGGGDYLFDQELKPLHIFQPLNLPDSLLKEVYPRPALAGVRLYDTGASPQWAGVAVSGFGIVYNPDLYATLGLPPPTRWADLTHPKLAGLLALADPTHSGSVATAYAMILQRAMADEEESYLASSPPATRGPEYSAALARGWKRGMSTLLLLAANSRPLTASATQVPADVGAGDAAAGISIDLYARVSAETLGDRRVRFVLPQNATAVTPDPVAILAGVAGERLTLARHFVEFLLSTQGQLLWALEPGSPGGPRDRALRRSPIRADVYATADRSRWSDPDDNPFATASTFNQRSEWMAQFADWRAVWRAAWIDARPELQSAYHAVLALPVGPKREQLLSRLADLPVEMSELDRLRAERKTIQSEHGDLEEWKQRQSVLWSARFRRHYAELEREARP